MGNVIKSYFVICNVTDACQYLKIALAERQIHINTSVRRGRQRQIS